MSSQFLSLEEAAQMLGVSSDELVAMRSAGKIRGFRDGSSWKFGSEDVKRAQETLAEERDDYDPYRLADSDDDEYRLEPEESASVPEPPVGPVALESNDIELTLEQPALTHDSEELDLAIEPKSGSTGPIRLQQPDEDLAGGSDLRLQADDDPGSDDEVLGLDDDVLAGPSPGSGSAIGSGLDLMEDLDDLVAGASGVLSDIDLGKRSGGSSLISGGGGSSGRLSADDDDDLLITDNEDELVLGGGSDLSITGDSGINLMSPSDSGISLESEPLDLAGSSSISAIDLASELGSDIGSGGSGIGSAPGAEDFQLSPSGLALDTDNDSSSQVIEVEDSAAFAEVDPNSLDAADFGDALDGGDAFGDGGVEEGAEEDALGLGGGFGEESAEPVGASSAAAYEVPYSLFQVIGLVCVVMVMSLGGMLMSDLVRNLWTYSEPAAPVSGLTNWLIDISPFGS